MWAGYLGEDAKVTALILRELLVEGLDELPHHGSGFIGAADVLRAVREAHADGLINVEHVGKVVEAVFVERGLLLAIDEVTRPVLLEQADHGRASRATVEPSRQGRRLGVFAGFEEPVSLHAVSKSLG